MKTARGGSTVSEVRYDGKVAIVTGGGRGMGRAHARLLAARGASVVVNDLPDEDAPAERVAEEITMAGGRAIASTDDISGEPACQALVDRAVEEFGRIDILVNNAAVIKLLRFQDLSTEAFDHTMKVNAYGPYFTARAAWPHFVDQQYGRIVMISSGAGIFGFPDRVDYGASKAAVVGITRCLAADGDGIGITANAIFPSAITRLSSQPQRDMYAKRFNLSDAELLERTPELVSPMVGWLSSEECVVNGEIFEAGEGYFRRILIGATEGYEDLDPTLETVRDHFSEIMNSGEFDPRPPYRTRKDWPTADLLQSS